MTILEASGKQEPEVKEAPSGSLEEVRAMWPVRLAPEGLVIKPTVSQDFFPGKGAWPPTPHPLYQDGKSVRCALSSAFSSVQCSASSTLMRGSGEVGCGVRFDVPFLS